jgi:hypothetical protein
MAIVPFDIHARPGGDVDFDGFRVDHSRHTDKYIGSLTYTDNPSAECLANPVSLWAEWLEFQGSR